MSTDGQTPLPERVCRGDSYPCPKCDAVCNDMHEWTDHVGDEHDPFGEFVDRWGGVDG